jgi:hypothetical protein
VIAWFAEAQARLTVNAWTPFGSVGIRETSRAMLGAITDGTTVPKTTPSTSFPSSSARWMSSATMSFPRSIAVIDLREVPDFTKGVRTPATIATRLPFPYRAMAKATGTRMDVGSGLHWPLLIDDAPSPRTFFVRTPSTTDFADRTRHRFQSSTHSVRMTGTP